MLITLRHQASTYSGLVGIYKMFVLLWKSVDEVTFLNETVIKSFLQKIASLALMRYYLQYYRSELTFNGNNGFTNIYCTHGIVKRSDI